MDVDAFWALIEEARRSAGEGADPDEISAALERELLNRTPTEVLSFDGHLRRRMAESYRRDLWAVGTIVNGGCSDDGFEYFRGWLLVQGREYFEAALQNPVRAADRADPESDEHECEDILGAAPEAYRHVSGHPIGEFIDGRFVEVDGREVVTYPELGPRLWKSEDDLDSLFPELCKRFSGE